MGSGLRNPPHWGWYGGMAPGRRAAPVVGAVRGDYVDVDANDWSARERAAELADLAADVDVAALQSVGPGRVALFYGALQSAPSPLFSRSRSASSPLPVRSRRSAPSPQHAARGPLRARCPQLSMRVDMDL